VNAHLPKVDEMLDPSSFPTDALER
jgi:hypothetical protein